RRRVSATPAQQHVAVDVEDAQASRLFCVNRATSERLCAGSPDQLADIDPLVLVDEDVLRPLNVVPFSQVLALRAEDLNAIVFTVAHEHPPIGVHPGAVRDAKLSRPRAGLTPRLTQLAA